MHSGEDRWHHLQRQTLMLAPTPTNRHLVGFLVYNMHTVVVQTVAANSASHLAAFRFMDLASTAFAA